MNRNTGFTLVELIVTIALAAIVLTIGVPSFQEVIRKNRLTTQTNDLVTTLNLARSEAIRRGTTVSICKSKNGEQCNDSSTCPGSPPDPPAGASDDVGWSDGWILFVNNVAGGEVKCIDAGEEIIQAHGALPSSFTLNPTSDKFKNYISYNANGTSNTNGTFIFCYDEKTNFAKTVIINTAGRVRIGLDSDGDGIPEKDDGSEVTSCMSPP